MSAQLAGSATVSGQLRAADALRTPKARGALTTAASVIGSLLVWQLVAMWWLGPLGIIASPTEIVASLMAIGRASCRERV